MAIPSGSGTEVLKNVNGILQNSGASVLTAGTNEIITVLSIIAHTTHSTNTAKLYGTMNDGSTDRQFIYKFIPGYGTFVWNDKIVLHPTHVLKLNEVNNVILHYWVSYILQDWT